MKKDVFNQYLDKICKMFYLKPDEVFTKTKKRSIVDARQLLFYLCVRKGIQLHYIIDWCGEHGYKLNYSSLISGMRHMEKKIAEDRDYISIIKDIESRVVII